MSVQWVVTSRHPTGRADQYEPRHVRGKIGIRYAYGNRCLRPYYIAGPWAPEDPQNFSRLELAKAAVEEHLKELEVATVDELGEVRSHLAAARDAIRLDGREIDAADLRQLERRRERLEVEERELRIKAIDIRRARS